MLGESAKYGRVRCQTRPLIEAANSWCSCCDSLSTAQRFAGVAVEHDTLDGA